MGLQGTKVMLMWLVGQFVLSWRSLASALLEVVGRKSVAASKYMFATINNVNGANC